MCCHFVRRYDTPPSIVRRRHRTLCFPVERICRCTSCGERGCVLTPLSTTRRGGAHQINMSPCDVAAPRNCPAHDRPPGGAAQLRYVHLTRARRLRCGVKCAPEPQSYQSDMPPSIASGRHRAVCFPLNGYDVTYHLAASRAASGMERGASARTSAAYSAVLERIEALEGVLKIL